MHADSRNNLRAKSTSGRETEFFVDPVTFPEGIRAGHDSAFRVADAGGRLADHGFTASSEPLVFTWAQVTRLA
jgi:hypothetical protein